ncbi:hypothetical protein HID58_086834, partial [Brassica napus]
DDCPLYENARERGRSPQWLGISQSNSMARLDEKRRKYEDMRREKAPLIKKYREHSLLYSRRNDYDDRREEPQYKPRHQRNYSPVVSEYRRGGEDPSNDRSLSRAPNAQNGSRGSLQVVDRPNKYVEPYRNNRDKQEVKVEYRRDILLPPSIPHSSDLRRSLTLRDESEERGAQTPAKEHLSLPSSGTPSNGKSKLDHQENSISSSRLQDIEIQYLEEIMEPPRLESNSRPSGSKPPGALSSPPAEASPIRTLSEDRRHVSLHLGPLAPSPTGTPIQARLSERPVMTTRSAAKRKEGITTQKKKYNISPLHGTIVKKRRVTKIQSSPKRKTQG